MSAVTDLIFNATKKDIVTFKKWLVSQGAEIMPTTNEWEVLRFRCGNTTGIAYKNSRSGGRVRSTDAVTQSAWCAWKKGEGLPIHIKPKRHKRTKHDQTVTALIERDGNCCWFCNRDWGMSHRQTIEHLVAIAHGGPNHLSNLVLACESCNLEAGHMSVAEKVTLRTEKRTELINSIFEPETETERLAAERAYEKQSGQGVYAT